MPGGTIAVGMLGGGPDKGRLGGIACQPYAQSTLLSMCRLGEVIRRCFNIELEEWKRLGVSDRDT